MNCFSIQEQLQGFFPNPPQGVNKSREKSNASLKTSPRSQGRRFTTPIILLAVLYPASVPACIFFAIKASALANKFEEVVLVTAFFFLFPFLFAIKKKEEKRKFGVKVEFRPSGGEVLGEKSGVSSLEMLVWGGVNPQNPLLLCLAF